MDFFNSKTTTEDQKIAQETIKEFEAISKILEVVGNEGIKIKVENSLEFLRLPKNAVLLLLEILQNMAEGKSLRVLASDAEMSTQQAADMLNVSRPHLVKLLENNKIPFTKVGSHRRVLLNDVLEYKKQLDEQRVKQLNFLSKQAQDLKLGYE